MNKLLASNFPKISVIMPVYNGIPFLSEAIESILKQTYKDFELIIIDDHSVDDSVRIIQNYAKLDTRIHLIKNDQNIGVTRSLNKAIRMAQGEFIARMDADDVSLPERFIKQVEFLETHAHIGIVGANCQLINEVGKTDIIFNYPNTDLEIHWRLLLNNAFCHPCVMFRSSILQNGAYKEEIKYSQDYELWSRLLQNTQGANLNSILLLYRRMDKNISTIHYQEQQKFANFISRTNINNYFGGELFSDDEVAKLRKIVSGNYPQPDPDDYLILNKWIKLYRRFSLQFRDQRNSLGVTNIKMEICDLLMKVYFYNLAPIKNSFIFWLKLLFLFPRTTLRYTINCSLNGK